MLAVVYDDTESVRVQYIARLMKDKYVIIVWSFSVS